MTDNDMNDKNPQIKLTARWDHDQVPMGKKATRGLLLDIEVAKPETSPDKERPPVNLALVIDRSGSMRGEPMYAAIEAAVGVAEQLGKHDRLSVVGYDSEIETLVDGMRMTAKGRKKAELAIRSLHARSMTNLSGGWLQGARCVAKVMERHDFNNGHVILLSDGQANQGEVEPERLAVLAGELAERNVTSTCVGIGAHYSMLQMAAIAENGQGEMHQSSEPAEIIEVLMGELGEQTQIVARNFTLSFKGMGMHKARQLTRYRKISTNGHREYFLGNLVAGQKRRLALLVDLKAYKLPGFKHYKATATWLDAETAMQEQHTAVNFELGFVPARKFDKRERNKDVAMEIASIWMARQGYEAMMLNERGLFAEAVASFDSQDGEFIRMVEDLEGAEVMLKRRRVYRDRTSSHWDNLSKKEAMMLSEKRMRNKPDHRASMGDVDWADIEPD